MQRWSSLDDVPADWRSCVVTIGVFDGVHRGHQLIIGTAVKRARERGVPALVLTFDPHPSEVVRPGTHPEYLTNVDTRVRLLGDLGADVVLVLPFTREVMAMPAADFVTEVLVGRLCAELVVVGSDFHFGARAAGNVALMREVGEAHGLAVESIELVQDHSERLSSTTARMLVADGDVAGAAAILGRPHRVEGVVVHGDHRGRELGYPTANLASPPYTSTPADGVYAGWLVRASGERLPAAISVGTNPTFDGTQRRVEAYVIDETLDLYDEWVAVEFAERLRGMERFDGIDALVAQMGEDVERARKVVAAAG